MYMLIIGLIWPFGFQHIQYYRTFLSNPLQQIWVLQAVIKSVTRKPSLKVVNCDNHTSPHRRKKEKKKKKNLCRHSGSLRPPLIQTKKILNVSGGRKACH